MFGIGPLELLIVLGIVLLLFGSRLPSLARSMGKSITEFKRGMHDDESVQDRVEHK
jgi:sec-independent protein translocase protein TatA